MGVVVEQELVKPRLRVQCSAFCTCVEAIGNKLFNEQGHPQNTKTTVLDQEGGVHSCATNSMVRQVLWTRGAIRAVTYHSTVSLPRQL